MAKTYNNLFPQIYAFENLHAAYLRARKGKRDRHEVRAQIETFLADTLRLRTNSKTQVFPVGALTGRALDFLGYRIWPTHRKLRKSSISRITRTLRRFQRWYAAGRIALARVRASVMSWLAHAAQANARGLVRYVLGRATFTRKVAAQ